MKPLIFSLAAAAALNLPVTLAANSCSLHSPSYRIALLELYTSEGCSSCPLTDRFVSGLRNDGAVVLSEHVDYWNHIGWKDSFSSKITHNSGDARLSPLPSRSKSRRIRTTFMS
ncbi:DUF1223 domain-containing protein [Duganella sp. BuS-21]|uniref:DUF1223 domain-containing protein n=1 Tax=Duganella sp. BuS-21 TaxID=2943848 RepID=UPI0035A70BBC